jgi:uncharacterized protein
MKRSVLLPLILLAALAPGLAGAQGGPRATGPNFDCAKATTATEKEICRVPELSDLDGLIGRYYAALMAINMGGQNDRVRQDQLFWVREREKCSAQRGDALFQCLSKSSRERLVELAAINHRRLAAEGAAPAPISGDYRYRQRGAAGTLLLIEWPDKSVSASISTFADNTHSCTIDATGLRRSGMTATWSKREDPNDPQTQCDLKIAVSGNTARVDSPNCRHWCGMRGIFTGTYSK